MRIVLFKTLQRKSFLKDPFRAHYLGFSSLKSYLSREEPGHELRYAWRRREIVAAQPALIGLSSVSEAWNDTGELIRWLRRSGFSGPIVVGGPHITALPETLPAEADCAVVGPGELPFVELVRAYQSTRNPDLGAIRGLAFRRDGRLQLTPKAEPIPLDELPIDVRENPDVMFAVSTIRGCPFHCQHCVEHPTQGKMRYLSAGRLLEVMQRRVAVTGNPDFFFQDDTFLAVPGRLERLYELMEAGGLLGKFAIRVVSLNSNLVRDHTIEMLKAIGVQSLGMGCESFNPRMLTEIKSGVVRPEHLDRTIRLATRAQLPIGGSQVYGYPGETEAEIVDSIRRVKQYEQSTTFRHWTIFICQPLPGSKLWHRLLAQGVVSPQMDFSTLRIDGDYEHFTSPWAFVNPQMTRQRFIDVLRREGVLPRTLRLQPKVSRRIWRGMTTLWHRGEPARRRAA